MSAEITSYATNVDITLDGAPSVQTWNGKRTFNPKMLTVSVQRRGYRSAQLTGPMAQEDGTEGDKWLYLSNVHSDQWPEWAAELVDRIVTHAPELGADS